MDASLIEQLRKASIEATLGVPTCSNALPLWIKGVNAITGGSYTPKAIFDLGDHLGDIFKSGANGARRNSDQGNSSVSAGGTAWEGLVCWYLNLCLIGSRAVAVKNIKLLVPSTIRDSITVSYNNFSANSETDIMVFVFPDKPEFTSPQAAVPKTRLSDEIDKAMKIYYAELVLGIIQAKTNWNDNAQIPMLWDLIYTRHNIPNVTVGNNGRSISALGGFSYAFVTAPTQKNRKSFQTASLAVNRVRGLSGGNFWGHPTRNGVSQSIKEIFNRNYSQAYENQDILLSLELGLKDLKTKYGYFGLHP